MKPLRTASALLLAASAALLPGQPPTAAPTPAPAEPLIVDLHPSPYRATIYYRLNLSHQRFDMRDATLLDLISFAYDREGDAIVGGPPWIDFDHFDVAAKVPAPDPVPPTPAPTAGPRINPYEHAVPTVQRTLAERFHLKYHIEQRPLPGFVVTVAKEGTHLTESKDQTGTPQCRGEQDKSVPGLNTVTCTGETMAQFLASFGGVYTHPVIDRTGLTKAYDFTLRLNYAGLTTRDAYVHLYTEAFRTQLGLLVAAADVPQPALVIDSVDRPTPNPPGVAELIPTLPDLEFEVATIKPAAATEPQDRTRFLGSEVIYTSFSLQELVVTAWQLPTGAVLGNRPDWLDHTRFTVTVKLPPNMDARAVWQNQDQVDSMLQKLLTDRFGIKSHWGEQTQDGFVLQAGTPRMKKADPASRSHCAFGPPPGQKDVRTTPDSPFDHEFYCQNVTMDQFAELIQPLAGSDVKNRVANKTGLEGSYDFTVDYTSARKLRAATTAAAAAAAPEGAAKDPGSTGAADPVGGLGLQDAFRKELGLILVRQPGTYPALILDHIEQTPTEN